MVQIGRRLECGGVEFVVVLQPDGSFASLPAWVTEPAASRFEIGEEPHFPFQILRSMRAEVDALLGFLLSESKTETAHNGAQIRTSPTKPVRRGDACRSASSAFFVYHLLAQGLLRRSVDRISFVCLAARVEVSSVGAWGRDCGIGQTSTATPAEPGELPCY